MFNFFNGVQIPDSNSMKYLGMHLDRRLTWKDRIKSKKEQRKIITKCMYWLLCKKFELSNKPLSSSIVVNTLSSIISTSTIFIITQ